MSAEISVFNEFLKCILLDRFFYGFNLLKLKFEKSIILMYFQVKKFLKNIIYHDIITHINYRRRCYG